MLTVDQQQEGFWDPGLEDRPAFFGSMTQQQESPVRPRAELITAAAQPTPASTDNAAKGQFRAQAPHSIQASRLAIRTFFPFKENT
jgi:hypothetical protein